ncbi:TonB-dependent receptor [Flavobacteriaceae bacterium]|nr:TonB-dependent receptor [Flavobacteriaceae bacterium]
MKKILFLLLFAFSLTGFSQVSGTLRGKILEENQSPLFGATVVLEGTTFGAITDELGQFSIPNIPPGTYTIQAGYLGFTTQTVFNFQIKSVGTPPLNFVLLEASQALDEVVVALSPITRPKETPLSTQSLSAVEIANYPGSNNDVVQVAQTLPGVSPSIGGFRNDLIIRGGAPNEVVYYLDGIEIPNINHFSTQGSAGGPVGMLNVSFISDVRLSASAFGAQYNNPLSGVLQFTQRDVNPDGFAGNFRLSASEAAITLETPLSKTNTGETAKTDVMFSVRRSYLQFLFELIGLPIRPDYWDYQYKLNHKIDAYNSLSFVGLGSIDKFTVALPEDPTPDQQATFDQVPFINQNSNTVGVTWKRRFKDQSGYMEMSLSNNSLWNTYSEYNDNASQTDLRFQNDALESETKLRLAVNRFAKGWKWSHGFNLQRAFYENSTLNTLAGFNYNATLDFINYGVFTQGSKDFFEDRLALSFGFRMDGDTFTKGSNLLKTFSPRVSASYSLAPSWKLNGTAGVYYKIPPYTMLGFQNPAQEFINQDLDYTRSTHLVLGVEKILNPAARVSLEGFYKYYSDYPVSLEDGVSMANKGASFEVLGNEAIASVGKGKAYGLELFWQQKLTDRFFGIFSYTYFYSTFSGLDPEVFRPSVWDSRHLASFTAGYKFPRNWEVSARHRFAAATPFVPTDLAKTTQLYPQIILDYDRLGSEQLDAFNQLDIRIDKKWFYKKMALDFFIEVQNALANANPQPPSYGLSRDASGMPVNPRSLFQIPLEEGSVIPSFGVVIDF